MGEMGGSERSSFSWTEVILREQAYPAAHMHATHALEEFLSDFQVSTRLPQNYSLAYCWKR